MKKKYKHIFMLLFASYMTVLANNAIAQAVIATGQVHKTGEYNLSLKNENPSQAFVTNNTVIQGAKEGPAYTIRQNSNMRMAFQLQQFTWKEYGDNGGQLLKESGPLYGLHLAGEGYGHSRIAGGGTFKMNIFGGGVDYDGQTQAGKKVKTNTDYLGMEMNGNFALRAMAADDFYVKAFAGPAIRFWRRDINSKAGVSGYTEDWFVFDGRAGVGLDYQFPSDLKLFAEGGYKIPFVTKQDIDLSKFGVGRVSLEPDQTASPFAEIGFSWKLLFISGFYDSLRFNKSDVERKGKYYVYQPKSQADIWGFNIGLYAEF